MDELYKRIRNACLDINIKRKLEQQKPVGQKDSAEERKAAS